MIKFLNFSKLQFVLKVNEKVFVSSSGSEESKFIAFKLKCLLEFQCFQFFLHRMTDRVSAFADFRYDTKRSTFLFSPLIFFL